MRKTANLQDSDSRLGKIGFTLYLEGKARKEFERFFEKLNDSQRDAGLPVYSKTSVAQIALMKLIKSYRNQPRQLAIDFSEIMEL